MTLYISQFKPWAAYSFSNLLHSPVFIKLWFAWKLLLLIVQKGLLLLSLSFLFVRSFVCLFVLTGGEIKGRRKIKIKPSFYIVLNVCALMVVMGQERERDWLYFMAPVLKPSRMSSQMYFALQILSTCLFFMFSVDVIKH